MKVIIDRFEGNFAVVELENKTFSNVPILLVPQEAKEGDVLSIHVDIAETNKRKKAVTNLLLDL